jgi:hypothetical protein
MGTSTLNSVSSELRSENRRRSERNPYVIEAFVYSPTSTDPDERIEATSLNLSRHGVGFCIEHPLPAGAFYVVEIGLGPQKLVSEMRTVSCRRRADGMYEVGGEFI